MLGTTETIYEQTKDYSTIKAIKIQKWQGTGHKCERITAGQEW